VQRVTDLADALAGFVAAEGTFVRSRDARRFRFAVALGGTDAGMCELLRAFLGVGSVRTYPKRKPEHDDEVVFAVTSRAALREVVVPFIDEHLRPCYKRRQYEDWRRALLDAG
jgi:hypothetical protein